MISEKSRLWIFYDSSMSIQLSLVILFMIKDLGEDHQLQVVAEGLLIGSHFMQDPEPPSTGKLVHQFAEIARVAEADLLLATHHAYGIASHGGAKRHVRNF